MKYQLSFQFKKLWNFEINGWSQYNYFVLFLADYNGLAIPLLMSPIDDFWRMSEFELRSAAVASGRTTSLATHPSTVVQFHLFPSFKLLNCTCPLKGVPCLQVWCSSVPSFWPSGQVLANSNFLCSSNLIIYLLNAVGIQQRRRAYEG